MKTIKLGNRVRVSDPCYGTKVWCSGELTDVKEGEYVVNAEINDYGTWGCRVTSLTVIHKNYINTKLEFTETAPFEVGVDSGQAGIYDAEYYDKYHTENDYDDDWYDDICNLTLSNEQFGTKDDKCVVSSSGFGDGGYYCTVSRDNTNKIIGISIVFIVDEDVEE